MRPAARTAGWCACATARCSTATGTTATSRARRPTARTWPRPHAATGPPPEVYRDLRAAAESGWDFSSRWLGGRADPRHHPHHRPRAGRPQQPPVPARDDARRRLRGATGAVRAGARAFEARAARRTAAVAALSVGRERACFADYLWREDRRRRCASPPRPLHPLFFGLATRGAGERVAAAVRATLLRAGRPRDHHGDHGPAMGRAERLGAAAMDGDRGPAPLTARPELAGTIARALDGQGDRRLSRHRQAGGEVRCAPSAAVEAGGGEYPTQDGFGWTNGVLRRLLALYPDAVARDARTAWCPSAPANDADAPPGRPGDRGGAATAR